MQQSGDDRGKRIAHPGESEVGDVAAVDRTLGTVAPEQFRAGLKMGVFIPFLPDSVFCRRRRLLNPLYHTVKKCL